uniref:Uncharacterized protein n=1 Tax=Arundo donax TaxID=35708 RepID=A0A0A9HQE8_ARUDO
MKHELCYQKKSKRTKATV